MYTCERCGTGFGRPAGALESCPRCLARDGVRVSLAVGPSEKEGPGRMPRQAPGGLEAAVRERLARVAPELRRPQPGGAIGPRGAA